MRILSNRFYGNKIIDILIYEELKTYVDDVKRVEQILAKCYPQSYQLYASFGTI